MAVGAALALPGPEGNTGGSRRCDPGPGPASACPCLPAVPTNPRVPLLVPTQHRVGPRPHGHTTPLGPGAWGHRRIPRVRDSVSSAEKGKGRSNPDGQLDYLAPKLTQKGTKDSSSAAQLLKGRLLAEHKTKATPAAAEPVEQPAAAAPRRSPAHPGEAAPGDSAGTALPGSRSCAAQAEQPNDLIRVLSLANMQAQEKNT